MVNVSLSLSRIRFLQARARFCGFKRKCACGMCNHATCSSRRAPNDRVLKAIKFALSCWQSLKGNVFVCVCVYVSVYCIILVSKQVSHSTAHEAEKPGILHTIDGLLLLQHNNQLRAVKSNQTRRARASHCDGLSMCQFPDWRIRV